jgi:hypothetical protein
MEPDRLQIISTPDGDESDVSDPKNLMGYSTSLLIWHIVRKLRPQVQQNNTLGLKLPSSKYHVA